MLLVCRLQVVAGTHSPAEAYEEVTELHARGVAAIQNIRKRARRELDQLAAAAPPAAAPAQRKYTPYGDASAMCTTELFVQEGRVIVGGLRCVLTIQVHIFNLVMITVNFEPSW